MELKTQSSRTASSSKKKKITNENSQNSDDYSTGIGKKGPLRKLKNIKIKKVISQKSSYINIIHNGTIYLMLIFCLKEKIVVKEKKKLNSDTQPKSSEKKEAQTN